MENKDYELNLRNLVQLSSNTDISVLNKKNICTYLYACVFYLVYSVFELNFLK